MSYEFSAADIEQMSALGISMDALEIQFNNFRKKFPPVHLHSAATVDNGGILRVQDSDKRFFSTLFDEKRQRLSLLKFIPASGAASRMFKDLAEFSSVYFGVCYNWEKEFPSVKTFIDNLPKFAFYDELSETMGNNGLDINDYLHRHDYATIVNYLLGKKFMGYGSKPKALLKFHKYGGVAYPAVIEHFTEGSRYARNADGSINLHFTVSPEHRSEFEQTIAQLKPLYKDVTFNVTLSEQKHYTDTIAVDDYNNPLRDDDGRLIFRPGGHGALLENLNECSADVVFIKNIDNVTPDNPFEATPDPEPVLWKKVLGGILLSLQEKTFGFLKILDTNPDDAIISEIAAFAKDSLHIALPENFGSLSRSEKTAFLHSKLNRPMRVCGMVLNQGEPGGGPFWVEDADGNLSLQIVETNQINRKDISQEAVLQSATHFNPVDLVCGLRDYKGRPFDLLKYRDPQTGFITHKSQGSKTLKSQELPGLWNGSMAYWTTVFVEAPLSTFNPVKTVNDLLRKEHLS